MYRMDWATGKWGTRNDVQNRPLFAIPFISRHFGRLHFSTFWGRNICFWKWNQENQTSARVLSSAAHVKRWGPQLTLPEIISRYCKLSDSIVRAGLLLCYFETVWLRPQISLLDFKVPEDSFLQHFILSSFFFLLSDEISSKSSFSVLATIRMTTDAGLNRVCVSD